MQDKFMLDFGRIFASHRFGKMFSSALNVYIQEINAVSASGHTIRRTVLSEIVPVERHFKIQNLMATPIMHICIDGDFIPFGQAKYDAHSTKAKEGRPDSIFFNENTFIFLELKVEQEDATFGKTDDVKWAAFFKGLTQIEDFVQFLRGNSIEITNYFHTVEAVICMRFEPKLVSNTKRNTEIFKRAQVLGFQIALPHNHLSNFNIS